MFCIKEFKLEGYGKGKITKMVKLSYYGYPIKHQDKPVYMVYFNSENFRIK